MPRRFITAEDVRRSGGEIVVDAETVVTPQALEAAAAAGVAIRQAGGQPYAEPVPDRGPDAALATSHLPHLPEPNSDLSGMTGVVVTVVGRNRPGVLAEITTTLAGANADVRDISQRTLPDYFHLVLTVALQSGSEFESFKQCMECMGGQDDYVVRVMHERVFRFMHRI
ncbi:MAG: ACT domain-containing protein [Planctomycetota bacterium]|nr:ACT domain-containing protein [Planctomycetota bacterium]